MKYFFMLLFLISSMLEAQQKIVVSPIVAPVYGEGNSMEIGYFNEFTPNQEFTLIANMEHISDCGSLNFDIRECRYDFEELRLGWKYLLWGLYINPELAVGHYSLYEDHMETGISRFTGMVYGARINAGYQLEYRRFIAVSGLAYGRYSKFNMIDFVFQLGVRL